MVSRVACPTHGTQAGILACVHIEKKALTTGASTFRRVSWDFLGDGSEILPVLLCLNCIDAFAIDIEKPLPSDNPEAGKLPYVAPICARVRDYSKLDPG
jgi:hypothetical protein